MKFNRTYFLITVTIFTIEVLISKFVHDRFIRPYIGDLLVVILIYCFIKSFFDSPVFKTAMGVLAFAFFIEALQYFRVVHLLNLQHSKIARTIIGTSFEWMDLVVYVFGIAIVLCIENRKSCFRLH